MAELRRWAIGFAILCAVGAMGCGPGETSTEGGGGTAGSGGTGGAPACADDPAFSTVGDIPEACGIWASNTKGNDTNEGTKAAPVASLARAIELAEQGTGRVYVCDEIWTEAIMVPSGISLHGGFDCDYEWWGYVQPKRTKLVAPAPVAMTWFDGGSTKRSFLTDFNVESLDATEPGGSSIAVFVRDELPLEILRCEFVAGNGADGADGADAPPYDPAAMAGVEGKPGANACKAPLSEGGAPPEKVCFSGTSKGGAGGDSSAVIAANGGVGEPAGELPGGEGGLGEQLSPNCTAGSPGAEGTDGSWGFGGGKGPNGEGSAGRLTAEGYVGIPGEDGKPGQPGQGGGGGGARFGSAAACGGASSGGASGGSGGTGGCGGQGGKGGQPGGASFALVIRSSAVRPQNLWLESGHGGKGGNGGSSQNGGWGAEGGPGGTGSGSLQGACAGGTGGFGGMGGYGGGGMGGPTALYVHTAGTPTPGGITTGPLGYPGNGGQGAPPDDTSHGNQGAKTNYLALDP